MNPVIDFLAKNPLVDIGFLVLLFGSAAVVSFLRRDAKRKRADKDPSNDHHADAEDAIADGIERATGGGLFGRLFGRKGK